MILLHFPIQPLEEKHCLQGQNETLERKNQAKYVHFSCWFFGSWLPHMSTEL